MSGRNLLIEPVASDWASDGWGICRIERVRFLFPSIIASIEKPDLLHGRGKNFVMATKSLRDPPTPGLLGARRLATWIYMPAQSHFSSLFGEGERESGARSIDTQGS